MKITFATGNANKVREVNEVLPDDFQISSLTEIGCTEDIPETSPTIEGNAIQKAKYVFDNYGVNCFSEDTGLEIDALGGAPGVNTARYAGEDRDPQANINLTLKNMKGKSNRSARFKTVIALIIDGNIHTFEGIAEGEITQAPSGASGFGYDPIFRPKGYEQTFAELGMEIKKKISHRSQAVRKLVAFLEKVKE